MTQSAVSRQIRKLEQLIGCELFYRVKQRLHLTPSGKSYAVKVRAILEQLEDATSTISTVELARLRVGLEPALATRWLIPKLIDFRKKQPDIGIELQTDLHQLYKTPTSFDVGILFGDGQWPDFDPYFLMQDELVAVCTKKLLKEFGVAKSMDDIIKFPLLHHTSQPSSSELWLKSAGFEQNFIESLPGERLEYFGLLVDAALQGLGVAILPYYFVAEELSSKRLVKAYSKILKSDKGYYLVLPKKKIEDVRAKIFSDWLKSWKH